MIRELGFTENMRDEINNEKVRKEERERILKAIEDAQPALDFFGPYIAKDKLIAFIKGEN
jgi:hypothetical protein